MCSRLVLLCIGFLSLGGCAALNGYPDNPASVATDLAPLKAYFEAEKQIAFYQSLAPGDPRRAPLRNEIIYGRVAAYDVEFAEFQQKLNRDRLIPDAAANSAVAVFAGAGTAITSVATKNALSAATSAVNGIKGAVDKDVFYSQTMSALFAEMSANRAAVLVNIDKGTSMSDTAYPLTRGLIDTAAYREAGSIPGALAGISHDAGKKTDTAKAELARVQDVKLRMR